MTCNDYNKYEIHFFRLRSESKSASYNHYDIIDPTRHLIFFVGYNGSDRFFDQKRRQNVRRFVIFFCVNSSITLETIYIKLATEQQQLPPPQFLVYNIVVVCPRAAVWWPSMQLA